jgi:hypothetical protein
VSDGKGILYLFPDRDFQVGFARHVPEVGETINAKGRMWTVMQVTRGADNRTILSLEPVDKPPDEPEAPFSSD